MVDTFNPPTNAVKVHKNVLSPVIDGLLMWRIEWLDEHDELLQSDIVGHVHSDDPAIDERNWYEMVGYNKAFREYVKTWNSNDLRVHEMGTVFQKKVTRNG